MTATPWTASPRETPGGSSPAFQLLHADKFYGNVAALRDVSLSVNEGEVVAIVGDNGAGKSTLLRILAGVLAADSGDFRLNGQPATIRSVADAQKHGIVAVYQDLALCDNVDTVCNLYLGTELRRSWRFGAPLDKPAMEHGTREIFGSLGISLPPIGVPVGRLSGGQRQAVAIARAVLRNPTLILLDEPTAALGVEQTKHVLRLIETLRAQGRAVAMVSHNLEHVLSIADRIVVMRLGRLVTTFDRGEADPDKVVAAITGAVGA